MLAAAASASKRLGLRVSRADREQAIDTLKAAFVHGRLTKDEFDERVGRALVPLTYAELVALTDDIPAGPERGRPRGTGQGMVRLRESNAAKAGAFAALVAGMVMIAAVGSGSANPLQVLATVLLLSPVWMLVLAGLLLLHSRLDRRAAGQGVAQAPDQADDSGGLHTSTR
jgi:hypothetical protein